MRKEAFHQLWQFLQPSQMAGDGRLQVALAPGRCDCGDHLLQVRVEYLVRVELRAVAGQVEDFNVFLVLLQPCLDGLAVVNLEVVQDQEHLLAAFASFATGFCVLDQTLHEVDEDVRVHRPLKGLPAHLVLSKHGTVPRAPSIPKFNTEN